MILMKIQLCIILVDPEGNEVSSEDMPIMQNVAKAAGFSTMVVVV